MCQTNGLNVVRVRADENFNEDKTCLNIAATVPRFTYQREILNNHTVSIELYPCYFLGVSASHTMAETDEQRMSGYKSLIEKVANNRCIQASVIAGQ